MGADAYHDGHAAGERPQLMKPAPPNLCLVRPPFCFVSLPPLSFFVPPAPLDCCLVHIAAASLAVAFRSMFALQSCWRLWE